MKTEKYGLLINYEYCTGCHTCEIACRKEKKLGKGEWGIKLTQIGPLEFNSDPVNRKWEWNFIPVPTDYCDLCEKRVAEGKKPTCVHHCLAKCMECDTLENLVARGKEIGRKTTIYIP